MVNFKLIKLKKVMEVTFESSDVILEDGPFPFEREDRPRSRTWPILPPPIETIHENEVDAEIAEPPTIIEEVEEPPTLEKMHGVIFHMQI